METAIEIVETKWQNLESIIEDYYKNLTPPMDDMWVKAIIKNGDYYSILFDHQEVGYFCLDKNYGLLQFYIVDEFLGKSKDLFQYILDVYDIERGFLATMDMRSLPLFMDFNKGVLTDTFLYHDLGDVDGINPLTNSFIRLATQDEIDKVMDYHINEAGIEGSWLRPYCIELIRRKELYLITIDGKIVATGERRASDEGRPYSHLGVTVSKKYRRRGVATYLLTYLKKECYRNGWEPICSTTIKNIGSQRAIEKAGFYPFHRILEVKFKA